MRRERFEARGIHIPYFAWPVGARVFQPNDSKAVLFFWYSKFDFNERGDVKSGIGNKLEVNKHISSYFRRPHCDIRHLGDGKKRPEFADSQACKDHRNIVS